MSLTAGIVPSAISLSGMVYAWPPALSGTVFTGPIVHWAHGRVGRGFAVLGMNLGAAGAGFGIGGFPVACIYEKCDGFYSNYGIIGSYVGATVGVIIDVALLSTYRLPLARTVAKSPTVLDSIVPMVDLRRGHLTLGMSGSF